MGEGAQADFVPCGSLCPDQLGVFGHVPADDEERRRYLLGGEQLEDLWGQGGVRPVVEGERHRARAHVQTDRGAASGVDDGSAA
nr:MULTISPECIES: hypothetical protein [Streptomyces]